MIGIIVAMTVEREAIAELMTDMQTEVSHGQTFYKGELSGHEIVLAEGGVGKVAGAITATHMMDLYDIELMMNIGTAGGIKDYENILDVVVADRVTYHDWVEETINNRIRGFETSQYVFTADEKYVSLAAQVMSGDKEHQTFIGHIVSGDAFISENEQVEFITKYFPEAIACDMESTSIGHACTLYGKPFVIIRSLSDIVTKENNGLDFVAYAQQASSRAAVFTKKFISLI